jgi:hypothetical protein
MARSLRHAHKVKPADGRFIPVTHRTFCGIKLAHNKFSRGIKLKAPGSTQRVNERSGVTGNN